MSRKLIIINYAKSWFFIDLISSVPYTWFLALSEGLSIKSIEADDQMNADGEAAIPGALANTP